MSDRDIPSWVAVGAEVISHTPRGWGRRYGSVHRIAKVFKNGNFKIEGSDQQYHPFTDYASKTGNQGWHRTGDLTPLTEERRRAAELERKVEASKLVIEEERNRLEAIFRSRDDDAIIAAAAAIRALTAKDGEVNR